MPVLDWLTDDDKKRIVDVACVIVALRIERGEILRTELAIKAAMPKAVKDAKRVVHAAWQYMGN